MMISVGGGGQPSEAKRIQADNLAVTECVYKISAFYVSEIAVLRRLEGMRTRCASARGYAHTETGNVCRE